MVKLTIQINKLIIYIPLKVKSKITPYYGNVVFYPFLFIMLNFTDNAEVSL